MHWAELNPGVRLYHLIMVIYQMFKSVQVSFTNHKIPARHSGYEQTGGRRVQTSRLRQLGRVGLVGRFDRVHTALLSPRLLIFNNINQETSEGEELKTCTECKVAR